jgi:hypothetical protein
MYKFTHSADVNMGIDKIEFTLHTDSSLTEMCHGFENFLRANGYVFDGSVLISETDEYSHEVSESWQQILGRNGETIEDEILERLNDVTPSEWDAANASYAASVEIRAKQEELF